VTPFSEEVSGFPNQHAVIKTATEEAACRGDGTAGYGGLIIEGEFTDVQSGSVQSLSHIWFVLSGTLYWLRR
jgi:hypothetical protein